jgi:hypothetical protein
MILIKNQRWLAAALSACLLLPGAAFAQTEAVLIKRPAQLRDAPGEASRSLTALPVQTTLTRLGERQGPWIKVQMADGTQGWVHMFDITSGSAGQTSNAGTSALRSITGFFNRGSAQANASSLPTSTVGIRGLGAEDIANSQPDVAAVAQLDANRLSAAQARQFAGSAALASRVVSPLQAPAAPAKSPAAGNNNQTQSGG